MSRWLKSVNNILEKLDDGTAVAAEAGATARRFLSGTNRRAQEDDDDDYDDEEDASDSEYEDYEDDEGEEEDEDIEGEEGFASDRNHGEAYDDTNEERGDDEEVGFDSSEATTPEAVSVATEVTVANDDSRIQSDSSFVAVESQAEPEKERAASSFHSPRSVPKAQASPPPPPLPAGSSVPPVASLNPLSNPATDAPNVDAVATSSVASVPTLSTKPPPPPPPPPPPLPAAPRSIPALSPPSSLSGSAAVDANANAVAPPNHKKLAQDYKKALSEIALLQASNASLRQQLERAEQEVQAQHDELMGAAASLAEERAVLKEEKDEFLADHEEEMETLQQQHQDEVKKLHGQYQSQIKGLQESLKDQKALLAKQGGDLNTEVSKAMEDKKLAMEQVTAIEVKHNALQQQFDALTRQHESLQQQCLALGQAAETAREAERLAEEKMDASLEHHKHQLALRQAREAELERTVAELGAALTSAQAALQSRSNGVSSHHGSTHDAVSAEESLRQYKERCEVMTEELESAQTEVRLVKQRCEALERDVIELSAERDAEIAHSQQRQREYDERIAGLMAQLSNREGSSTRNDIASRDGGGDDSRLRQVLLELDETKKQVESLSDQLMRQQGAIESSKSEALALKGRLQAANSRADAAEVALASATASSHDLEGGGSGSKSRRRVKGGLRALGGGPARPSHLAPRSVRAALGLRVVSGSTMEQVAMTIDALDNWMIDTGSILKAEPLARFGLAVYLAILHCWCFALVFFHAVESEHGDLGALTHRAGPFHPGLKHS